MNPIGFFWKVFGGTVAVILITALGVYWAALPSISEGLRLDAEQRVEREARWVQPVCQAAFDVESGRFDLDGLGSIAGGVAGSRFTLILGDGQVLLDSEGQALAMDNHGRREELLQPGTVVSRFSLTMQREMTYFALPIEVQGQTQGFARISVPVERSSERVLALRAAIRNGVIVAGLISLLLAWYSAGRVTKPLSEITALVTEIGSGQTARRLSVEREDEVGLLARAVNHMADDLVRQVAKIERDRGQREAIFSALAGGLLAVNQQQEVRFINPQCHRMIGGLLAEPKGRPVWELTRNHALTTIIEKCLASEEHVHGEANFASPEGERTVEITAVPMDGDGSGRGKGCVLELRDVSDLRRLEGVRRDFIANVSHELKTPLTAMRGYTEAILEDEDMPASMRRSFLIKAQKNTDRLTAIVGDLLSLTRLESDEGALAFEPQDVVDVVRNVMGDLEDLVESRAAQLILDEQQPGLRAKLDEHALGMALSNLIGNALHYSEDGAEVRVVLSCEDELVRIDVIDQGTGIPPYAIERVFERFYRVDKARSRKLGGTGLGLAIVRHVMKAHGGRVELESTLGVGSRFSLFLPSV